MKIKILTLAIAILTMSLNTHVYASEMNIEGAEDFEISSTEGLEILNDDIISTRASYLLSTSSWALGPNACGFSLSFLTTTTGSATVTLQKQSGSSWIFINDVDCRFSSVRSFSSTLSVSSLTNGSYRLKISLNANNVSETVYSPTKTL